MFIGPGQRWKKFNYLSPPCWVIVIFFNIFISFIVIVVKKGVDREADNRKLLQLEEKDVISSVATVLSDLCEPSEWMPMLQLHEEVSFPPLRTIQLCL
jgi:hypothetical protein